MITLGLVDSVDDNGVYVTMPGSKGVLRGPYKSLSTVAAGTTVLVASTDDGEQVVVGPVPGGDGTYSAASFGARGDGLVDDTAALQSALDAAAGAVVVVPAGEYVLSDTLAVPAATELRLHNGAVLKPSDAETTCLTLAAGSTLEGGTIQSPEWWDGTNAAWTYAVVLIEDDNVTVRDVTLENVPRVGIGIREGDNILISGCRIRGNVPDDYDPAWTDHFGVCNDTKNTTINGDLVVTGNIIDTCIQGVYSANWGSGTPGRGLTISGNTFYGCYDHGVYVGQGEGYSITANSFNRCSTAIACTGSYHTITGNSITTGTTGGERDWAGISVRDPIGCVVASNTVKGETLADSVMVDVRELVGTVCRDNVITGNTVIANDGSDPSVGIRVGGGTATDYRGNIVSNNVVRAPGRSSLGVIHAQADSSATDMSGTMITGNRVTVTGPGYGIAVVDQSGAEVSGNDVRLEYDAPSAATVGLITVTSCDDTYVVRNRLSVSEDWGANVALRGVWEAGSTAGSRIERNWHSYDPTKITSSQNLALVGGSGAALVDEYGTGAPSLTACVGSLWRRLDGGTSTTLYVKESGTGSSGWVAK